MYETAKLLFFPPYSYVGVSYQGHWNVRSTSWELNLWTCDDCWCCSRYHLYVITALSTGCVNLKLLCVLSCVGLRLRLLQSCWTWSGCWRPSGWSWISIWSFCSYHTHSPPTALIPAAPAMLHLRHTAQLSPASCSSEWERCQNHNQNLHHNHSHNQNYMQKHNLNQQVWRWERTNTLVFKKACSSGLLVAKMRMFN